MKNYLTIASFSLFFSTINPVIAMPIGVDLGSASNFAVLGGSTVTNTGPSIANGNLGVWPGTSVIGFPPGIITNGTIYKGDAVAMHAEADALTAFNVAAGTASNQTLTGTDLGGQDLFAGVYTYASSAQLTGTLTLDAQGSQDAVFIFQIGSTLTTASNAQVSVINGQAGQIFWQVGSSATLGTDTTFNGDIVALTSITLNTGATIGCGSAMALNGAVTLDTNTVSTNGSACTNQSQVSEPASLIMLLAGLTTLLTTRRWQA